MKPTALNYKKFLSDYNRNLVSLTTGLKNPNLPAYRSIALFRTRYPRVARSIPMIVAPSKNLGETWHPGLHIPKKGYPVFRQGARVNQPISVIGSRESSQYPNVAAHEGYHAIDMRRQWRKMIKQGHDPKDHKYWGRYWRGRFQRSEDRAIKFENDLDKSLQRAGIFIIPPIR